MLVVLATLVTASQLTPATASTAWPVISASDPTYPQKVDFATACKLSNAGAFDPIVFPGVPGGHRHTFSGATSINPNSTADSLLAGGTNCKDSLDKSSYWMPSLYKVTSTGVTTLVEPYEARAYYRAGTTNGASLAEVPFGLQMIAGSSTATTVQSAGVAGFQCRNLAEGNVVPKQALPPVCPTGTFLESSVVFPNCWDGKNLDSADHKSHMSYASASKPCDLAHPVRLPALTYAARYPVDAFNGGKAVIAAAPGATMTQLNLHADFINAWTPKEMTYLTRNCLRASVACATITDTRRPPVA
ncbi:MAG: hypothetical protein JWM02_3521 [Frankiales bacterium]|nr:hypothetical protein [Frankiales bacterium]